MKLNAMEKHIYELLFYKLKKEQKDIGEYISCRQEILMKELELSKPTIIKYLKSLEVKGYIKQKKFGRGLTNNIYCLKKIEINFYWI